MNAVTSNDWEQIDEQPLPTSKLHDALAKAQGEFASITRDKTVTVRMKAGGTYTFSYAPLESILHAVIPALSKNALALTQAMQVIDGKDYVETTLRHASGQSISNRIPLFVHDSGAQAYGSALTYARRYGVTLLLCVSADDDDDGNAAEGNQATTHAKRPQERGPSQEETHALAARFKTAFDADLDMPMLELHEEANKNQEMYEVAWALLPSNVRARIKLGIEKAKCAREGKPYIAPQPRGAARQ